jgi:hypothetical protein
MELLLTQDELVGLTGRRRARDQVIWIEEHYPDCPAHVNTANEAVVVRAHLERATARPQKTKAVRQVRNMRQTDAGQAA